MSADSGIVRADFVEPHDVILKDVAALYRLTAEMNVIVSRLRSMRVEVSMGGYGDRSDPLSVFAELRIAMRTGAEKH
jgi:hypothetical protein